MGLYGKIHQLQAAMSHILKDLKENDLFNIVEFHSWSEPWSDAMVQATKENVEAALNMVEDLNAEGGDYLCSYIIYEPCPLRSFAILLGRDTYPRSAGYPFRDRGHV